MLTAGFRRPVLRWGLEAAAPPVGRPLRVARPSHLGPGSLRSAPRGLTRCESSPRVHPLSGLGPDRNAYGFVRSGPSVFTHRRLRSRTLPRLDEVVSHHHRRPFMPAPRSRRRARLAALVSVVLAITGFQFFLAPPAAQATSGGTGARHQEVVRRPDGNAGRASTTQDFVELYNPTAAADPLDGHGRCSTARRPSATASNAGSLTPTAPVSARASHYLVQWQPATRTRRTSRSNSRLVRPARSPCAAHGRPGARWQHDQQHRRPVRRRRRRRVHDLPT